METPILKIDYVNEMRTRRVASTGLLIGGIFGMAGSFMPSASLRGLAWGIDGVGLIVATALLTVYYLRKDYDVIAAGFLVFAIGEALILSCSSADLEKNISSFGAGTSLWAAALTLISVQKMFPVLVRCLGLIAAALFALVSVLIFTGHQINPLTEPLPFYAYPFFAATIFGWALVLFKTGTT
jgi:hypothetical protein